MTQGIAPYVPNTNPSPPVATVAGYGTAPSYLGQNAPAYNPGSTSGGPNILGGGMYTPAPIPIDQNAFNNPVGAQAGQQLSGLLPSYLGATTGGVQANVNPATSAGIAGQQQLAAQYGQLAAGQGPSQATVAAQQAGAQNLAQAESMLGSARGAGSPAAAQQAAANARATGGQQVAQNVVAGKTAEELGALGAQGQLYGSIAGQGLTASGQANQVNQGNQANTLAAYQSYLQSLQGINSQQQQGQIAGQQLAAQTALGQQDIAAKAYQNAAANNSKLAGSVQGLAGSVLSGAVGAGLFL